MKKYAEVKFQGHTYEVLLHCEAPAEVFVVKAKRLYDMTLGTYRQRITSAPKIKRLIKLALAQE